MPFQLITPKNLLYSPTAPCSTPVGNTCIGRNFIKCNKWIRGELGAKQQTACCPVKAEENSEDQKYKSYNYNGLFHKPLQHNTSGPLLGSLTSPTDYERIRTFIINNQQAKLGDPSNPSYIPLASGSTMKLVAPLASISSPLVGAPLCLLSIDTPPPLSSNSGAAEMVELYAHAMARDVPFKNYGTDGTITTILNNQHINEPGVLSSLKYYTPYNQPITAGTLFRGATTGDHTGPHISQFLLLNVVAGALSHQQLYDTPTTRTTALAASPAYRVEWGVNGTETATLQNGSLSGLVATPSNGVLKRYIFSGRSLAEAVHNDPPYQFFYQTACIMNALKVPINPQFPSYVNQANFVSSGGVAAIHSIIGDITGLALQHAWYWKWQCFRRLRPEAFGLYIHNIKNGTPNVGNYDIHNVILNNGVLVDVSSINNSWGSSGSYTLPMCYREGSPCHPAYPSGHATISGACCTILKIFYSDTLWSAVPGIAAPNRAVLPTPLTGPVIEAAADGQSLEDYSGGDESSVTVHGELNKLASNVSFGRNWAGIHYRSDAMEGMRLGEQVAIRYMEDKLSSWVENGLVDVTPVITFTGFDGSVKTVKPTLCK